MFDRTKAGAAGGMLAAMLCAQTAIAQFTGFFTPDNYALSSRGRDTVILDANADGFQDVAVIDEDGNTATTDSVKLFLNNGDGTFAAPMTLGVGYEPVGITSADFNNDGLPDLAVVNKGSSTGDFSVLLNTGGTFAPEAIYVVIGAPVSIDAGLVNADQFMDLVIVESVSQTLVVYYGSATGVFTSGGSFSTLNFLAPGGENPREVVLADLNGNGLSDAVVATSHQAVVMYNTGSGGFFTGEFATFLEGGVNVQSVAAGNLTADGRPDIVIASRFDSTVRIYQNNAVGTYPGFAQIGVVATPLSPISVILADLGGAPLPPPGIRTLLAPDGDLDILVSAEGANALGVSLNSGGTFSPMQSFASTGSSPERIDAADLDNDGDIDVAMPILVGGLDIFRNKSTVIGGPAPVSRIDSPLDFTLGGCVSGTVTIVGVADVAGGMYDHDELWYRPLASSTFTQVGSAGSPAPEPGSTLYYWNTSALAEGFYMVRLKVFSLSGMSTTDEVVLYVSQDFDTVAASSAAIAAGNVCIEGTVWDSYSGPNQYTVEFAPTGSGAFSPVDPLNPVYFGNRANERLADWDSTSVPDGFYDIRVTGTNGCGLSKSTLYSVVIDNTPPISVIDIPLNCDTITPGSIVNITGAAMDANMRSWTVQYTGGDSNSWVTINSGISNVFSGPLASWDTTGLRACSYTLRLVVTDQPTVNCGNAPRWSVFLTSIDIGCKPDMNGDGFLDNGDIFEFINLFMAGCI